jgi:hypothetical protein
MRTMRSYALQKIPPILRQLYDEVLRPRVWMLDGTEVSSGEPLRLLYVGSEVHKNYIGKLAFAGSQREQLLGREYLWSLPRLVDRSSSDCSLMIIEGYELHRRVLAHEGDFYVPLWLRAEVDVPLLGNHSSAKEDLRKVRKSKLTFEVTKDWQQLDLFYNSMHLPYIYKRHPGQEVTIGYDDMMEMARRDACELLLVREGSEYIAGVLLLFGDRLPRLWAVLSGESPPRMWVNGMKDGDLRYWKHGAIAATYYFASTYLSGLGYRTMGMGATRAFLADGLTRYKRKWGMRVVDQLPMAFLIRPLAWTPGVRGFFVHNPFAYLDEGRLCGAVFVADGASVSDVTFASLQAEHAFPGLEAFHGYQFTDGGFSRCWTSER